MCEKMTRTRLMIKMVPRRVSICEADSYAYEKVIRKWTKFVFFFGTKNISEGHLMHTVLVCYVFDKLGQACLCG